MKILVTAGGTGGHIYPAIAIVKELRKRYPKAKFLYVGTTDRMEGGVALSENIDFIGIEVKGLIRKLTLKNFSNMYLFFKSLSKTKAILKEFEPDIVIGTGGYVTTPVIYMARKLGIKTLIHEQNSIPGLSNKFLSLFCDKICISFLETKKYFNKAKTVYTGNPTSQMVVESNNFNKKSLGLSKDKKLILIVMGSLGSLSINNKMKKILEEIKVEDAEILMVTGKNYYEEMSKLKLRDNIKLVSYLDNMGSVMKSVDVMISRAGATTMAEIIALKVPTIFIPSPYVTNNHQYKNAKVLKDKEAAEIILENELSVSLLEETIQKVLVNNLEMRKNIEPFEKKNSLTSIVDEIEKLLKEEVGTYHGTNN